MTARRGRAGEEERDAEAGGNGRVPGGSRREPDRMVEGLPMKGVAFLFPGARSVRQGMLLDLAADHPDLLEPLRAASEAAGCDLEELVRSGPAERLREDPNASLAALAADVSLYRLLEGMGIAPVALAGYGAGFQAAAVAAGVLPLASALALAAEEQRLGWEAVGGREFHLASVEGLNESMVDDLLGDLLRSEAISLAAQDAPCRCTLAGEAPQLRAALDRLQGRAVRTEVLPHRLPRHTPAMAGVPEGLNAAFGRDPAEDPRVPLYSHFDGSIVLRGWQAKELMMKGMIYPLRWDNCVRGLVQNGIDTFVEVGPGTWLSELVREIESSANVYDTDGPASIERLRTSFSSWNF